MIGVDISDRSVKLVQLANTDHRDLLSHCWREIPDGVIERGVILQAGALKKVLQAVFKQCRLTTDVEDSVVASIPETQSFLRVIEVPAMSDDEIGEAVQWEVAQHIPFGLENVYIDWQSVGGGHAAGEGRREVLVGAAQKKVVDPLLEVLNDLKLDVAALELESQALVRALISEELRRRQGILIVDLGGVSTNVVIHDHGAMRFTASLQQGANRITKTLTEDEQALLSSPRQEQLPDDVAKSVSLTIKPSLEELVVEILGVVDFYNSVDVQHKVREVLLTGGGSNFPGLDAIFLKYFDNVHVQRGNPWVNVLSGRRKKPPLMVAESVHFATALGLALRSVSV